MESFENFFKKISKDQVDNAVQEIKDEIKSFTPKLKETLVEKNEEKQKLRDLREDPVGYDHFNMRAQRILEKQFYDSQIDLCLDRYAQYLWNPPLGVWKWEPTFALPLDTTTSILSLIPHIVRNKVWWYDLFDPEIIEIKKFEETAGGPDEATPTIEKIKFGIGSTFIQTSWLTCAIKATFDFQDPFDNFEEDTAFFLDGYGYGAEIRPTDSTSISLRTTRFCNALHCTLWHRFQNMGSLELCGEVEYPFSHGELFYGIGARSNIAPGLFLQGCVKKRITKGGWDVFAKMDMDLLSWFTVSLGLVNSVTEVGLKVEEPSLRLDITF